MTRFLRRLFAWPALVDQADYCELRAGTGSRLAIYRKAAFLANLSRGHAVPTSAGGALPVELYVTVADPAAVVDRACRLGARLLDPVGPRSWGDVTGYVAMPGGCVLALARPG